MKYLFIIITMTVSFSIFSQAETIYSCSNQNALEDGIRPGSAAKRVVVNHDTNIATVEMRSMRSSSKWEVLHEIGAVNSSQDKFRVYDFEQKARRTFAIKNGIGRSLDISAVLVYEYADYDPRVFICSQQK